MRIEDYLITDVLKHNNIKCDLKLVTKVGDKVYAYYAKDDDCILAQMDYDAHMRVMTTVEAFFMEYLTRDIEKICTDPENNKYLYVSPDWKEQINRMEKEIEEEKGNDIPGYSISPDERTEVDNISNVKEETSPNFMYEKFERKTDFINSMYDNAAKYIFDNFMTREMTPQAKEECRWIINKNILDNRDFLYGFYEGALKTCDASHFSSQTNESMAFRETILEVSSACFEKCLEVVEREDISLEDTEEDKSL